jgi:translocation and assembly module TamB
METEAPEVPEANAPTPRRSLGRRIAHWLGIGLVLLLLGMGVLLWGLDTGPGHRFLADRVAGLAPSSGLKIRIGRIDGSIYSRATLRDVRLSDPTGLFLEVPELRLDWRPMSWAANRLDIRSAVTDLAILYRLPKLRPSKQKQAILPGFDIRIDRLAIRRLRIEPPVTGTRHVARILADADIRDGRARINLAVRSTARDYVKLVLDAEPDRDRFDIDLKLSAPSKGVIGAIVGTQRPIVAQIAGEGRWSAWHGKALAIVSGFHVIDLALTVDSGRYRLNGTLAPAPITSGKVQRLTSPTVKVDGMATLADRKLDSRLSLRSGAATIDANGVLDLAQSSFEGLKVDIRLLKPPALFPNMTGRDVRLRANFEGSFATAAFDYELTAPRIAFDATGFETVRVVGRGHLSKAPILIPIKMTARQVTGVGDVAGGILRNLSVDGAVKLTAKALTGDALKVSSDKLQGKIGLYVDLATGRFEVTLSGALKRYLIPGLGIVDVLTDLKVVPGAGGHGSHVEGRGRAWVRRFDNAFLRSLAGGLPQIDTRLVRDRDGILHFVNLKLTAPAIRLTGTGYRRSDGTFYFKGSGTQQQYGPLTLLLDGNISRPKLDIALARPMDALGLEAVRLLLDPVADGFAWRAQGGSTLGPFDGNGRIILQPNSPALIAINGLDVTGTHATGGLRVDPGGFTGKIVTAGGGIDGTIGFNPVGNIQRIEPHLSFARAQLGGIAEARVGRGQLDGVFLLDPAGLSIDATIEGRGLRRRQLSLGRVSATVSLRGGNGQVKARLAGSRGRAFDLQTVADFNGDVIRVSGDGTIDRKPIRLETPAQIVRTDDGWRIDQTRLSFAGGQAAFSGRAGGSATEVEASVQRMPLSVLDVVAPNLAFGGYASGRLSYRLPRGGLLPVGDARLTIRGLTRSGLVLSSRPVDLGIAARLTETAFSMRAIAMSEGKAIGRAQARVGTLTPQGTIIERISRAPIFAQLRYNGPADTLWRLTGIESIDLSGPIAIGADVTGISNDPRIRGSLRTTGARMESAVTGTVIERIRANGTFGGSVLKIDDFAGTTPGGGTVTGTGTFDLAAVNGFGMNLAVQTDGAQILNRDDIGATVTGPLTIHSDGSGGTIAGDVKLLKGRFRLGRAAVTEVPRLNIVEINRAGDEAEERVSKPWQLDIKADARNRLMVSGLGLDSEWRATLAIKGTVDNPAITGRADLVRGGYEFAGRRFDLDRGTIRFLGEAPPDPVLDIAASASIQGLNASIQVSGTGQHPEIRFSSIPALPEDELLSRLLFGTSITNLSAPEALQLAAAVASLRGEGGGLNPINAVRRAAGLDRLRILPADVTTGQGTSVAAGKYIGRRTYVELITDGQGYSATKVEFQITRWLSILSSVSTIGRQSVNVRVSKDY